MSRMRRLPSVRLLLAAGALVLPPHGLHADQQERLQVGLQPDGRVVVPTNQILQPAGVQVLFPGRPVDLALLDGGRTLVVKNLKNLVFIDVATGRVRQTLASPVGFSVVGVLAHARQVYVTDVKDHLRVATRNADGLYEWKDPVELDKPRAGGSVHPAGIAAHSANAVWVASTRGNSVQFVNVTTGKVEQVVGVGVAPYAVCCPRAGLCYVSNWGGDPPREGDAQAPSSGTPTRVDERGIASQGTVSVLELEGGKWRQVKIGRAHV